MNWYAPIQPGLEPVLAAELKELGFDPQEVPGGVRFEAGPGAAALAWTLRTPTALYLELIEGPAKSTEALAGLVRRVKWKEWLRPTATLEVEAVSKTSRLHMREIMEKQVRGIVADMLKGPRIPDLEKRARVTQTIRVRLVDDIATLSLDAGGELLHLRGWRQSSHAAPLRENIAAALLRLAGWSPNEALLDPFCGVGTIPIEAALWAAERSPFTRRAFACQEWPSVKMTPPRPKGRSTATIVGADKEPRSIVSATENAQRAGVSVRWQVIDVNSVSPPAPEGLILTNPPYGHRLGQNVRGVYVQFGRTLRERFPGWRVWFLCPDGDLARAVNVRVQRVATIPNGGLKVGVWALE